MIKGINIDQALFRHLKKSIFTFKPYVYIFQAYKGSEGIDLNQGRSYDDEDRVKRPRIDPGMKQHSLLFREAAKKVSQLVVRQLRPECLIVTNLLNKLRHCQPTT